MSGILLTYLWSWSERNKPRDPRASQLHGWKSGQNLLHKVPVHGWRVWPGMAAACSSCWWKLGQSTHDWQKFAARKPRGKCRHIRWSGHFLYFVGCWFQSRNPKTTVHDQSATKTGQKPLHRDPGLTSSNLYIYGMYHATVTTLSQTHGRCLKPTALPEVKAENRDSQHPATWLSTKFLDAMKVAMGAYKVMTTK